MSGAHCPRFPTCMEFSEKPQLPKCTKADCPGARSWADVFPELKANPEQNPLIDTEQSGHGLSLLPCPFCGGRPHQGLMKAERCQLHGEEFQMYRVWCSHGCAQKIGASKDIAYKEWNTRANAETNTRKVSESKPRAGFADPIPATSGAMPSVEDVARLVDPVTYGKYDRLKADGTKAANGQPWCDVVHGRVIEYALERARAILALFPTDSVQQRPQNESSRVADGQATKSGGVE